jgi:GntR family transcriptional regulator
MFMKQPWLDINKKSGMPIYVQLEERIRFLVHKGVFSAGDPLPTVRALAVTLGINANTVSRVYRDLEAEGVLRLERGVGTFVAATANKALPKREFDRFEKKVLEVARMAKTAGMTAPELALLIQAKWKEV